MNTSMSSVYAHIRAGARTCAGVRTNDKHRIQKWKTLANYIVYFEYKKSARIVWLVRAMCEIEWERETRTHWATAVGGWIQTLASTRSIESVGTIVPLYQDESHATTSSLIKQVEFIKLAYVIWASYVAAGTFASFRLLTFTYEKSRSFGFRFAICISIFFFRFLFRFRSKERKNRIRMLISDRVLIWFACVIRDIWTIRPHIGLEIIFEVQIEINYSSDLFSM